MPSESTMVRALRSLDIRVLETYLVQYSKILDDDQIVEAGDGDPATVTQKEPTL